MIALGTSGEARANGRTCTWSATGGGTKLFSGANWSCTGGTGSGAPTTGDIAQFSGTSTKDCSINAVVTAAQILVNTGYTGTISTSGAPAITLTGSLTISSGTFSAGASAISVGGNLTISVTTFTTTGTVTMTGTSSAGTITSDGTSFGALTINGSGGTYTLQDALSVASSLTITAGTLAAGTRAISVGGNWSNSGTFTGSGTVTMTGTSSAGTIKSGGKSFGALTINGIGGTYTLQDALSTSGNLTLSAGSLVAGAFGVTVGGSLSVGDGVTYAADPTLVGYWAFDDAAHTLDSSGNGHALTWTGSPSFPTTNLPSLVFDPTNAYGVAMTAQTSNSAAAQYGTTTSKLSAMPALCPATVSLSAWYKATSTDKVASEIVSGSNTYGLRITSHGLVVMKRIGSGTSADWIEYQVPFAGVLDGNWHQIVGVIVPGTGGGMTAYLDGAPAAGAYFIGGTTTQLDSTTTPTAAAAASAAIDWTDSSATETAGLVIGYNPSGATGYNFGANYTAGSTSKKCGSTDSSTTSICAIDDVRVYNRALTASDVAALSRGNATGGSSSLLSLSGAASVTGNATVSTTGTLTLASGSSLSIGTGSTLAMNGTLNATSGTIQGSGGSSYTFEVGSIASAAPELNVNGLTIKNTELLVNADTAHKAATTFARFDNVSFGSGTGTEMLQIYASTLYLSSNGCTFDSTTPYAVKLTAVGTGANPRALFGNATCATMTNGVCANSEKEDNDSDNDGVPDPDLSTSTGAVVQFIRAAQSDTDGHPGGIPDGGVRLERLPLLLDLRDVPRPLGRGGRHLRARRERQVRSTRGPTPRRPRPSSGRLSGSRAPMALTISTSRPTAAPATAARSTV